MPRWRCMNDMVFGVSSASWLSRSNRDRRNTGSQDNGNGERDIREEARQGKRQGKAGMSYGVSRRPITPQSSRWPSLSSIHLVAVWCRGLVPHTAPRLRRLIRGEINYSLSLFCHLCLRRHRGTEYVDHRLCMARTFIATVIAMYGLPLFFVYHDGRLRQKAQALSKVA